MSKLATKIARVCRDRLGYVWYIQRTLSLSLLLSLVVNIVGDCFAPPPLPQHAPLPVPLVTPRNCNHGIPNSGIMESRSHFQFRNAGIELPQFWDFRIESMPEYPSVQKVINK